MPCMAKTFECRIYKIYLGSGNPYYHGELCVGCTFWQNTPNDIAFNVNVGIIDNGKETREIPDWF